MTTYTYVDARGVEVVILASSDVNAARTAARVEVDRTGSVLLAYRAAGTIEPVAAIGRCEHGALSAYCTHEACARP
jgi:hypothetical protein